MIRMSIIISNGVYTLRDVKNKLASFPPSFPSSILPSHLLSLPPSFLPFLSLYIFCLLQYCLYVAQTACNDPLLPES